MSQLYEQAHFSAVSCTTYKGRKGHKHKSAKHGAIRWFITYGENWPLLFQSFSLSNEAADVPRRAT